MGVTTNQPRAGFLKVWTVSRLQTEKEALGSVKKSSLDMTRDNYTKRGAGQVEPCAPRSFTQGLTCPRAPALRHNLPLLSFSSSTRATTPLDSPSYVLGQRPMYL